MHTFLSGDIPLSIIATLFLVLVGLGKVIRSIVMTVTYARTFGAPNFVHSELGTFTAGEAAPLIRSKKALIIPLAALSAFVLVCSYAYIDYSFVWIAGVSMYCSLSLFARQRLPASMLVLGESNPQTQRLVAELNRKPPWRAVSFIEPDTNPLVVPQIQDDCFRVGPGEFWKQRVEYLCSVLPLLVLDLRSPCLTESVRWECQLVLDKFRDKAIIIGDPQSKDRVLEGLAMTESTDCSNGPMVVETARECLAIVRSRLIGKGTSRS